MCQRVDEPLDGLLFHLYIVQTDAQVCCQVQFAGQIAQHTLEERVDGFYAEVVVVVQQEVKGLSSAFANHLVGHFRLFAQPLQVAI